MQHRRVITDPTTSAARMLVFDRLPDNTWRPVTDLFVADLFSLEGVPQHANAGSVPSTHVFNPAPGQILFRLCQIPPEDQLMSELSRTLGKEAVSKPEEVGMHQTDSIDLVTVLSGDVFLRVADTEIHLVEGDTIVQRGTRHAWRNKSTQPCVLSVVMLGLATGGKGIP